MCLNSRWQALNEKYKEETFSFRPQIGRKLAIGPRNADDARSPSSTAKAGGHASSRAVTKNSAAKFCTEGVAPQWGEAIKCGPSSECLDGRQVVRGTVVGVAARAGPNGAEGREAGKWSGSGFGDVDDARSQEEHGDSPEQFHLASDENQDRDESVYSARLSVSSTSSSSSEKHAALALSSCFSLSTPRPPSEDPHRQTPQQGLVTNNQSSSQHHSKRRHNYESHGHTNAFDNASATPTNVDSHSEQFAPSHTGSDRTRTTAVTKIKPSTVSNDKRLSNTSLSTNLKTLSNYLIHLTRIL
eukprot:GHVT01081350.1.p1 GENE.GHVT01081350.1~~GHVT01081350.1.p1  ORF type:complete len:300 (-),score=32.63 GHVT01081350.1:1241-2140(-)